MSTEAPPRLGSYAPEDVTFLLTDLSGRIAEQPVEEREALLRSGARHYSETLAAERPLSPDYQSLVEGLLESTADGVAALVGILGERLWAERGAALTLVSLARAGTPVGILLRRWMRWRHGVDVPHFGVSVIRDRGLDLVAMRWIAARHDAAGLRLVDGWTGKGVICREVAASAPLLASEGVRLDPTVAVLADPGRCTRLFATRRDVLIPTACLNATISGLLSRTILDRSLLGPGDFHGVAWHRHLAAADRSAAYIDLVAARFPRVAAEVAAGVVAAEAEPPPGWEGMAETRELMAEHGIHDLNRLKPGIGEATRVLLRRVPRCVLVDPARRDDLGHVLVLAGDRGIPVLEHRGGAYACWAVIAGEEG